MAELTLDQRKALALATARKAQAEAAGSYNESYLAQGMSGLNEGIGMVLGAPVDLATAGINLGIAGLNAAFPPEKNLSSTITGETKPRFSPIEHPPLGSEFFNGLMGGAGAIKPETDDPGKQMVRRVAQDVGAATVPVLGTAGRAARPAAAIAKELALSVGSGTGAAVAQQLAPDNPWAELAGQILGGASTAGVVGAGKRLITPFPTSPARRAAVDTMAREGVDLTAGQRTGSKPLQYAESELGGARIGDITEQQGEQFTSAALRRAGVSANRATPEVMDRAFTDNGHVFDDLAARNTLAADHQMVADLRGAWQEYTNLVAPHSRAPVVENTVRDLADIIRNNGGAIDGPAYQAMRSRLDKQARASRNDPQLQDALFGIRNALDEAMERSISPEDAEAWGMARHDYRNLLVIEKASQGAGENAAMGLISPAALRQAATSTFGKRSYVRGRNEFSELAQSGQATMTALPQSGTAPRTAVRNLGAPFLSAVGAMAGSPAGLPGSLAGAAAGAAIPHVAGRAILSPLGRRYLANQVLDGVPSGSNGVGAVTAALSARTADLPELTSGNSRVLQEMIARDRRKPVGITVRGGNPAYAH